MGEGGGRRSVQEGLFKEVTALVNIFYENLVTFLIIDINFQSRYNYTVSIHHFLLWLSLDIHLNV